METAGVILFIALFTLACWGLGKLFASKQSPTVVGQPLVPNAQTEAANAANQALVPTSEFDVIVKDVETDVKDAVADVKSAL
ncbi:MAG TPA: hypothetical protein VJ476_05940 [Rhizomicrobium sp.]|nr:hypothetical protein [Rhizomicrobium sp.]